MRHELSGKLSYYSNVSKQFMRISGEAQCPIDKHVEDPTDTNYSIEDVFFNICGLIDGSFFNQLRVSLKGKFSELFWD